MATPQRLSADALASELSKLPSFTASSATALDAVQIAMARAIASGQSANQLATDLGVPAGRQGIDLSKPPAIAASASATDDAVPIAAASPQSAPQAAAPDWIGKIVPLALAREILTRVAVLDREPTALGGLEGPAWARALVPSATYGPVAISSASLQVNVSKWIHIYNFSETVEFVRAGQNRLRLCVVRCQPLRFQCARWQLRGNRRSIRHDLQRPANFPCFHRGRCSGERHHQPESRSGAGAGRARRISGQGDRTGQHCDHFSSQRATVDLLRRLLGDLVR